MKNVSFGKLLYVGTGLIFFLSVTAVDVRASQNGIPLPFGTPHFSYKNFSKVRTPARKPQKPMIKGFSVQQAITTTGDTGSSAGVLSTIGTATSACIGHGLPITYGGTLTECCEGLTKQDNYCMPPAGATIPQSACADTDGGKAASVWGKVSGGSYGTIAYQHGPLADYCNPSNGMVVEYFCTNDSAQFTQIACPSGSYCQNGACVSAGNDTQPPSQPVLTLTPVSSTQMRLTWTPSTDTSGIAYYKILSSSGPGTTYTELLSKIQQTSYYHEKLQPGITYWYAVEAYDNAGNHSRSLDAWAMTLGLTTAPSITVLSPNGGEQLATGSAYPVKWTIANLPATLSQLAVYLALYKPGNQEFIPGATWVLPGAGISLGSGNVPTTGTFTWKAGQYAESFTIEVAPPGMEYKITAVIYNFDTHQVIASDMSDAFFSLVSATSTPVATTTPPTTWQCAGPGLRADIYGGPNKVCCAGLVLQGGVCNQPVATSTPPTLVPTHPIYEPPVNIPVVPVTTKPLKITICHLTQGKGYEEITVDENGWLSGHKEHAQDYIKQAGRPCEEVSGEYRDLLSEKDQKIVELMSRIERLEYKLSQLEEGVNERERDREQQVDRTLTERLKGRILLQAEEKGEAWYVDPETEQKFYLKDGTSAYQALQAFGLGISNTDLKKIPVGLTDEAATDADSDGIPDAFEADLGTDASKQDTDGDGFKDGDEVKNGYNPLGAGKASFNTALGDKLKGKIVLQVESRGEAWYVNPTDGKRYYLKDGERAYDIMRKLSLGITNENLSGIPTGSLSSE